MEVEDRDPAPAFASSGILSDGTCSGAFALSSRVMIKVYPDRRWPAFLGGLADTVTVAWTIVSAYLGFLIYQTSMGRQAIAGGITSTRAAVHGGIATYRH